MSKIDGGPAFPLPVTEWNRGNAGMSMRDWFAGQALAVLLSNPNHAVGQVTFMRIGQDAYRFADAMLAAREATNDPA